MPPEVASRNALHRRALLFLGTANVIRMAADLASADPADPFSGIAMLKICHAGGTWLDDSCLQSVHHFCHWFAFVDDVNSEQDQ
jgi:hypothetical protein